MRTTERIMWLLIGAAAGTGIALLYAPQSGDKTRKLITRKAEDTRDKLVETGESILETGKDVYKKSYEAAAGAASGAADLLERGRRVVMRP
jgi:gas vesicle protein